MSTKTSIKRIALVAVSALGFGLLSVVPAKAADATMAPIVSNQTMVRTDDATYDDAYTLAATGDLATYNTGLVTNTGNEFGLKATFSGVNTGEGALVKVGYRANSSGAETLISTVTGNPTVTANQADVVQLGTGIYLAYRNTTAGTAALGTPVSGVYTITNGTDNTNTSPTVFLNFGRTAAPGLYTLYVKETTSTDYSSVSLMLADMPSSVRIRDSVSLTSEATRVGNGTLTYNVQVRDSGGRDSYLLGTERVRFAVTGGSGSGLTITTPSLPTIGSGDLKTTSLSRRFQITATATSAAGTYTITGTMEGFSTSWTTTSGTATASITSDVTVNAVGAYSLGITSAGCTSNATAWSGGVCASDIAGNAATSAGNSDTVAKVVALGNVAKNYLPTTQRTITLQARFVTTVSGDAKFTITNGNVSGVADGPAVRLAPIVSGPVYNTATITYTADYANADEYVLFQVEASAAAGGNQLELAVVYKNPVPGYIEVSDPAGGNVRVSAGSTNNFLVTVLDQFGSALGNTPVTFTTSAESRNASATYTLVTNASGQTTFTHADTYVGSDGRTTDAITVTAVNGTSITGGINVVYGLATTANMTMVVNQPAVPGTTATYNTDITTITTKTVTVDDTPDSTSNPSTNPETQIADQLRYDLTLTNDAGGLLRGQPVSVTATEGVYFTNCSAGPGEVSTTVSGKRSTRTCYANASGAVSIQAAFTKSGVATVTFTSGTVVKTHSILVLAGTARNIAVAKNGSTVTATVTDLRGNPVASHPVTITASGVGRFANGVAINSVNTSSTGEVSYDVFGTSAGTTTITASMAASVETVKIADATYGLLAGNRTASLEMTVGTSAEITATQAAIEAANAAKAAADAATAAAKAAQDATTAEAKAATEAAAAASDAALEAIDAANAATDAANLAAEAADAATVAAEEARDAADAATAAVEALAADVATLMAALKAQITTLGKTIAKIAKKVKA